MGQAKSLLSAGLCVRSRRSLLASPGAEAALCEVSVMVSLGKSTRISPLSVKKEELMQA